MRQSHLLALSICCAALVGLVAVQPATVRAQADARYRIETRADRTGSLQERFSEPQLALLGKAEYLPGQLFGAYEFGSLVRWGPVRLLERDAQWLFEWGQTWLLDASGSRVLTSGTPVFIVAHYDFDAAPPWRSLSWLSTTVELPSAPMTDIDISGRRP